MQQTHLNEIYYKIRTKLNEIHMHLINQENGHLENQIQILNNIQKDIDSKLDLLDRDAEWDMFTIAFYGETNAGKSTLIEALRIYFKEKTKMDSWNEFNKIYEPFLKQKKKLEQNIHEQQQTIEELSKHIAEQIALEEYNRKSLWYRLLSFFKANSLAKQIKNLEKELDDKKSIHHQAQETLQELLNNNQHNDRLLRLSDGTIIGNGQSDFTREITSYTFNINNQDFQILDVPGIEGNESQVINSIDSATRKAHCVFYITRASTPPQKGDDGKEGTLEKIKKHLGAQSEVYSIFNKPTTNPRQLEQDLVNEDERQSLKVLDEKMRETLGEHYAGRKDLSAKVAFLALAECLFSENSKQERDKFLSKYDSATLLQKSRFDEFADFIAKNLIKNTQTKIKKSHHSKAIEILWNCQALLEDLSLKFKELLNETQNEVDNAKNTLGYIKNQHLKTISNKIDENIEKLKINARIETYNFIDSDVSDKEFEKTFKMIIRQEQKILENNLVFDEEFESIQEELDNFKRCISYIVQDFTHNLQTDFEAFISMDMKSGIDTMGIVISVFGVAALALTFFWNPIGWVASALSVAGIVIGLGKAAWKYFSSDYKKSEQKRVANENLQRMSEELRDSGEKFFKNICEDIDKYIQTIQQECDKIIENIHNPYKIICQMIDEVEQLNHQIQGEIT